MITKARIYTSNSTSPYHNLAVEEYLLNLVEESECILYLWQNRQTVVIGRNQNAFMECKTERLEADGGFLARRLSGGGSVYHDMGNLNFTFLVHEPDYDVDRQLSVIIKALEEFGLYGEKSGRNDICIDGKKFSGNAFYRHKGRCYHHGTILVDVDLGKMSQYLNVSAEKLKSNSVSSVRSRVVNLNSLNSAIGISGLRDALTKAFGEIYAAPRVIQYDDLDAGSIEALAERYASNDWRFGQSMKADYTVSRKYSWGEITILLRIQADKIVEVQVFTDAMDESISEELTASLNGARFAKDAVTSAFEKVRGKFAAEVFGDIMDMLKNQEVW